MSGWTAAILSIALVLNPPGVGRAAAWGDRQTEEWRRQVASIVAVATAILITAGLLTAPLLDLLSLSTPTFRLATAVVVAVTGAVWMVRPTAPITELGDASAFQTLGLTMLLTPGPVFAAMAANGDAGTVAGVVSVAIGMTLVLGALLVKRITDPGGVWSARVVGAATIVAAVGIGIDSARTV
ncbi:MAG: hypothetical protein ACR2PK_15905 [Acidimicrobiales bacterium]